MKAQCACGLIIDGEPALTFPDGRAATIAAPPHPRPDGQPCTAGPYLVAINLEAVTRKAFADGYRAGTSDAMMDVRSALAPLPKRRGRKR